MRRDVCWPRPCKSISTCWKIMAAQKKWRSIYGLENWCAMKKPTAIQGYDQAVTDACERVLVTLVRHLGPWRDSIFLVGGLTPRYLIKERPPAVPAHAGTADVVVDMQLLADTEAYPNP